MKRAGGGKTSGSEVVCLGCNEGPLGGDEDSWPRVMFCIHRKYTIIPRDVVPAYCGVDEDEKINTHHALEKIPLFH